MKLVIRQQILDGKLEMPKIPNLKKNTRKETYYLIERMFSAMWKAYLLKGPGATISTPYWTRKIGNIKAINIALKTLSVNNWIVSNSLPNNNWAEAYLNEEKLLEYVTKEELIYVRKHNKFSKYMLKNEASVQFDITKIGTDYLKTGIIREGFMKSGNTQYQFDTDTMFKYKNKVAVLINKGIDKMIEKYPQIVGDLANYKEIGNEIVESLIYENGTYRGGNRTNDPRGRNNRGDLNKIANPVGFKIMRSLLIIPENKRNEVTTKGLNNVFLFIGELHGFKNGTKAEKIAYGQTKYLNRVLLDVDLDDFFENVWLERMYDELDTIFSTNLCNIFRRRFIGDNATEVMDSMYKCFKPYKWSVPIEIDMSALTK